MHSNQIDANFWEGKDVLITGHTGFKGSWLSLWLSELGAKVTGIALQPETQKNLFEKLDLRNRLETHNIADIRDHKEIKTITESANPEVVLHLAAQPLVRRSYKDPLGTWATNVQGSLNLLEALKTLQRRCAVVMVTTDKVYANKEWDYGYRENDQLGGNDPYSASKAAAELAITSWRTSFCGEHQHQTPYLAIATARAGNVIGGGDWGANRIMPDAIRALAAGEAIKVRNPESTRPWQHVLEPLSGYLILAEQLAQAQSQKNRYTDAFNFGPDLEGNRTVRELIEEVTKHWDGCWVDTSESDAIHEASRLNLQIDKVHHQLKWRPRWNFETTVEKTVNWYKAIENGEPALKCCLANIKAYERTTTKNDSKSL